MNSIESYEKYAQIRDAVGLRDVNVAEATGVSRASLSQWKAGRSTPKIDKLILICKLLNVDLSTFVGESKSEEHDDSHFRLLYQSLNEDNKRLTEEFMEFLAKKQNINKSKSEG